MTIITAIPITEEPSTELHRARQQLGACEAIRDGMVRAILRLTLQKRELMAALDKAAPEIAAELDRKFKQQESQL